MIKSVSSHFSKLTGEAIGRTGRTAAVLAAAAALAVSLSAAAGTSRRGERGRVHVQDGADARRALPAARGRICHDHARQPE